MTLNRPIRIVLALLLLPAAVACQRGNDPVPATTDPGPAAAAAPEPSAPAAAAEAPVSLDDVIETDPRYVVGISYPPGAAADPGLARALHGYAEAARAELMQAVSGLREKPTAPYELSLGFREVMRSSEVVAVAADGSLYTGGAHGMPLVERFVWLPGQQRMLTADTLLASPESWKPVAAYIREQLGAAVATRAADEDVAADVGSQGLADALKMIAEGTTPEPANFTRFEPLAAADGRIGALRFVFPPYQVGPYSDGVQTVEVPAAVLRPYLADDVRGLFSP